MSRTTIIPLKSQSAALYVIEDEGTNYDDNGKVLAARKAKPSSRVAKKPAAKSARKHHRRP